MVSGSPSTSLAFANNPVIAVAVSVSPSLILATSSPSTGLSFCAVTIITALADGELPPKLSVTKKATFSGPLTCVLKLATGTKRMLAALAALMATFKGTATNGPMPFT